MTARVMWKAEVVADDFHVPVKLYAAVEDRNIHFHLLDAKSRSPVVQQMIDPRTEKPVPPDAIRKGIEVGKGEFVLLNDDDLASIEPPESRDITVEEVIDRELVDERWYDRPYYLGPDGDTDRYFALADALGNERIGISTWAMRKKQYVGALHTRGGYLMLETLRFGEEIIGIEGIPTPASRTPDKKELALAEQIIGALEEEFDPDRYHDEYREKVLELVDAKGAGKILQFPGTTKKQENTESLLDDLEASLKGARNAKKN